MVLSYDLVINLTLKFGLVLNRMLHYSAAFSAKANHALVNT